MEEFCFSPETDLLRVDTPCLTEFDFTSAYRILFPFHFYRFSLRNLTDHVQAFQNQSYWRKLQTGLDKTPGPKTQ